MESSTRRKFIKNVGVCGAATGIGLAGGFGLAQAEGIGGAGSAGGRRDAHSENRQTPQPSHPFGYPEGGLDVERTRQLGYEGFKGVILADGTRHGGCAFGAFHAIVGQLAEVVGAPYTNIPLQMMDWAGAGVVGFGTLCGTLNGTAAAVGLICDAGEARGFISDLLTWYSESPLPTNLHAPTGQLPQSVAASNLCHVSLTHWCRASGFASGSPERAERCARVSGDVAAKAVELLNEGALGLELPSEKTTCRTCHYMGPDYDLGQFTHGEMNCITCHIDLKEKDVTASGH